MALALQAATLLSRVSPKHGEAAVPTKPLLLSSGLEVKAMWKTSHAPPI